MLEAGQSICTIFQAASASAAKSKTATKGSISLDLETYKAKDIEDEFKKTSVTTSVALAVRRNRKEQFGSNWAEAARCGLSEDELTKAHEVLDALAVERIERKGDGWCRQRVVLQGDGLGLEAAEPLSGPQLDQLAELGLLPLDGRRPEGWCTELHPGLAPWLAACAGAIAQGWLLVIDYALEARRYYAPQRSGGTLMAYRRQQASEALRREPGQWDLTAHLCLESLEAAARAGGWCPLGTCRQGQALLALGLAGRPHALQQEQATPLAELLQRRESLLRLVDPAGLGDFRWVGFRRDGAAATPELEPRFLSQPSL